LGLLGIIKNVSVFMVITGLLSLLTSKLMLVCTFVKILPGQNLPGKTVMGTIYREMKHSDHLIDLIAANLCISKSHLNRKSR
jgi:hypothetical protein